MKNSTRLLKTILIITAIFFFQFVRGQIVYTDVNPDQTYKFKFLGEVTYHLDLDNDGVTDFNLSANFFQCGYSSLGYKVTIEHLNGSIVNVSGDIADKFEANDTINAQNHWDSEVGPLTLRKSGPSPSCQGGIWKNNIDNYVGLRIPGSSGIWYYGWARLSVTTAGGASFTIKDYAVNSRPNESILAGLTCPPQAKIIANGPTTFCLGDSAIISSVNAGTNLSYQWKLNSLNINGATNKNYTAKTAGNYKVKVTDNTNVCSAISEKVKVKVPCKVLNEELNNQANLQVSIFPNPFSQSTTTISFSIPQTERVSLRIFDVSGRLIETLADGIFEAGENKIEWDAAEVNPGLYFLRMETENYSEVIKAYLVK